MHVIYFCSAHRTCAKRFGLKYACNYVSSQNKKDDKIKITILYDVYKYIFFLKDVGKKEFKSFLVY